MSWQDKVVVVNGDALDILAGLPEHCVDAVVCDPPYGLSDVRPDALAEVIQRWAAGDRDIVPDGKGFMGKDWDAFVPPPAVWDECYRLLKPGGHLLAFAGTRTFDVMALSIRFAGFEIRDSIGYGHAELAPIMAWCYGSGFPKSMDVSKAIDKAGGVSPKRQAEILRGARERARLSREQVAESVGCTVASVRDWEEGRARATGSAIEWITPSPEYRDKLADLLGYTADERRVVGAAADRRGDGTVIGLGHSGVEYGDASTDAAKQWEGWGTALKPAWEPIIMARKPLQGTVAANVLEHGTGALNIDACRIATDEDRSRPPRAANAIYGGGNGTNSTASESNPAGRWPTNVVLDEAAAEEMDKQSGDRRGFAGGGATPGEVDNDVYGKGWWRSESPQYYADSGGASRFFPVFKYQAKAPKKERPTYTTDDGKKIAHPTVKPLELLRWLVKLVTPPGGTVLDPFAGSGTTGEAAYLEGFNAILIEREPDYLPLIEARMAKHDPETEETA